MAAKTQPKPTALTDAELRRELFTPSEVARWLGGVPENTVRALHRSRKLTGVTVGKHLRFRRSDLLRYVEELTAET